MADNGSRLMERIRNANTLRCSFNGNIDKPFSLGDFFDLTARARVFDAELPEKGHHRTPIRESRLEEIQSDEDREVKKIFPILDDEEAEQYGQGHECPSDHS